MKYATMIAALLLVGCASSNEYKVGQHLALQKRWNDVVEIAIKEISPDGTCLLVSHIRPSDKHSVWMCNLQSTYDSITNLGFRHTDDDLDETTESSSPTDETK